MARVLVHTGEAEIRLAWQHHRLRYYAARFVANGMGLLGASTGSVLWPPGQHAANIVPAQSQAASFGVTLRLGCLWPGSARIFWPLDAPDRSGRLRLDPRTPGN